MLDPGSKSKALSSARARWATCAAVTAVVLTLVASSATAHPGVPGARDEEGCTSVCTTFVSTDATCEQTCTRCFRDHDTGFVFHAPATCHRDADTTLAGADGSKAILGYQPLALGLLRVAQMGDVLAEQYPPETSMIVGIGRSPGPFIAYLQARYPASPGYALAMPLSGLSGSIDVDPLADPSQSRQRPHNQLFAHFGTYLGKEVKQRATGDKPLTVVLLDFSVSGSSLRWAGTYLTEYFKETKLNAVVHLVFFGSPGDMDDLRDTASRADGPFKGFTVHTLGIRADRYAELYGLAEIMALFFDEQFKLWSPHGSRFVALTDAAHTEKLPYTATYVQLRETLAALIPLLHTRPFKIYFDAYRAELLWDGAPRMVK
jgi:hypothetical protein